MDLTGKQQWRQWIERNTRTMLWVTRGDFTVYHTHSYGIANTNSPLSIQNIIHADIWGVLQANGKCWIRMWNSHRAWDASDTINDVEPLRLLKNTQLWSSEASFSHILSEFLTTETIRSGSSSTPTLKPVNAKYPQHNQVQILIWYWSFISSFSSVLLFNKASLAYQKHLQWFEWLKY